MVKNINMARFWKLLFIIPAVLLLFACSGVNDVTSATDQTVDANEEEVRQRECWQAAVVGAIYDTTSHITMGMYSHLTQGAMALMMVAFALWLAFRMLKHVSSFTEESPGEVWTEVLKKFFVCFVCGWLATSTTGVIWVLNSIVFPIYNAFLDLGSTMLGHFASEGAGSQGAPLFYFPFIGEVDIKYTAACKVSNMDPATPESFPQAPRLMMECLVCAVNERLNFGYKLGWVIITQPGFMALICGLIMMLLFTFIKIGFVFYLVDSVFRFAMMILLMPILIMAYAFKPTRKWTTTGFATILNSAAFLMCIAIVILITLAAIQQILIDNKDIFENKTALSELADFSKPLLMLMLAGFLLVSSMDMAKAIADKLIGGSGDTNFQKQFGTAALKVGKWAAFGLFGAVGKKIVSKSATLTNMKEKYGEMKAGIRSLYQDDDDDKN